MHMQGEPRTMQQDPRYDDVVAEVVGDAPRIADVYFHAEAEWATTMVTRFGRMLGPRISPTMKAA